MRPSESSSSSIAPSRSPALVYEVEECRQERTQEVRVEVSSDHGRSYRQVLVQEYTFSPQGAIFQHEELRLELPTITHLSLTVVPNKSGSGVATFTALRLSPEQIGVDRSAGPPHRTRRRYVLAPFHLAGIGTS